MSVYNPRDDSPIHYWKLEVISLTPIHVNTSFSFSFSSVVIKVQVRPPSAFSLNQRFYLTLLPYPIKGVRTQQPDLLGSPFSRTDSPALNTASIIQDRFWDPPSRTKAKCTTTIHDLACKEVASAAGCC